VLTVCIGCAFTDSVPLSVVWLGRPLEGSESLSSVPWVWFSVECLRYRQRSWEIRVLEGFSGRVRSGPGRGALDIFTLRMNGFTGFCAIALLCLSQTAAFTVSNLPSASGSVRQLRGSTCIQMKAEDANVDKMMKSVVGRLEEIKGRADFSGNDADNALSDAKNAAGLGGAEKSPRFMGSRR